MIALRDALKYALLTKKIGGIKMETKGLTCKIPLDLHNKISEEIREKGSTLSRFIEMVIREHYEKGEIRVMAKERTLAFRVSEELFQRIKAYLERYEQENHRRLTQREFVIGLIEQALDAAEGDAEESGETEETAPELPETTENSDTEPEGTGLIACGPTWDEEAAGNGTLPGEPEESDPGGFEAGYESAAPEQEIDE